MSTEALQTARNTINHWYLPLILGLIMVTTGVWSFVTPVAYYLTIAVLFAVTFLCTGILEIISALLNQRGMANKAWSNRQSSRFFCEIRLPWRTLWFRWRTAQPRQFSRILGWGCGHGQPHQCIPAPAFRHSQAIVRRKNCTISAKAVSVDSGS